MSRAAQFAPLSTTFHPSFTKHPRIGMKILTVRTKTKKHNIIAQSIHETLPIFPQDVEGLRQRDIVAEVRKTLLRQKPLQCITMIDEIQRLSIDYHFQDEIEFLLGLHSDSISSTTHKSDFFYTALNFRLMRQHGHYAPLSSIFHEFIMNHKGGRSLYTGVDEVKGLLALHEASYLGIEGEDVLDEVCSLSKQVILKILDTLPLSVRKEINHSLKYPIHKNIPRIVFRNYFESREGEADQGMSKLLLELAKTDYNRVQAMYRQELSDICGWWKGLDLVNALYFAIDNPVEWYMCSLFILPDPRLSKYRIMLAKSISFVYLLDDLFDVYGTAHQLTQFTFALKGWDASKLEGLPQAMKALFFAFSDMLNEASDMIIKEQGWNPTSALRKMWAGLCDAFLEEHRWFALSHCPTSDEYLRNGIISTGVPLSLGLVRLMFGEDSPKNTMDEALSTGQGLFLSASAILRLSDDLGSKIQRMKHKGHDGCYVDYYMKEVEGASFQNAVDHVRELIAHEWKAMNKECLSGKFSQNVRSAALNLARMSQLMYPEDIRHHGATEKKLKSLLEDIRI